MEDQISETDTSGLREDVNVIAFKEVVKKGESLQIGNIFFFLIGKTSLISFCEFAC